MYDYLDKIDPDETSQQVAYEQEVTSGVYLIRPVLYDDAYHEELCPIGDPCDDGSSYSGGGSSGSGSSGSGGGIPEPIIENFKLCDELKSNIWTGIFGPKVVCTDYHASDKRIKTKVWNQNYLLYSSIGISVRAQKRKLRIWWAQKVDELRLGFSHATFEFPKVKIQWPDNSINHYYTTQSGAFVDQYGRAVNLKALHPVDVFDRFPINDKDKDFFNIFTNQEIVKKLIKDCRDKDLSCNLLKIEGKDINDAVERLAKLSVKTLWNQGEGKLEEKAPILAIEMNDCFGSNYTTCNDEELLFTY